MGILQDRFKLFTDAAGAKFTQIFNRTETTPKQKEVIMAFQAYITKQTPEGETQKPVKKIADWMATEEDGKKAVAGMQDSDKKVIVDLVEDGNTISTAYDTFIKDGKDAASGIGGWLGKNWPMLAALVGPLLLGNFFDIGTFGMLGIGAVGLFAAGALGDPNSLPGQGYEYIKKATANEKGEGFFGLVKAPVKTPEPGAGAGAGATAGGGLVQPKSPEAIAKEAAEKAALDIARAAGTADLLDFKSVKFELGDTKGTKMDGVIVADVPVKPYTLKLSLNPPKPGLEDVSRTYTVQAKKIEGDQNNVLLEIQKVTSGNGTPVVLDPPVKMTLALTDGVMETKHLTDNDVFKKAVQEAEGRIKQLAKGASAPTPAKPAVPSKDTGIVVKGDGDTITVDTGPVQAGTNRRVILVGNAANAENGEVTFKQVIITKDDGITADVTAPLPDIKSTIKDKKVNLTELQALIEAEAKKQEEAFAKANGQADLATGNFKISKVSSIKRKEGDVTSEVEVTVASVNNGKVARTFAGSLNDDGTLTITGIMIQENGKDPVAVKLKQPVIMKDLQPVSPKPTGTIPAFQTQILNVPALQANTDFKKLVRDFAVENNDKTNSSDEKFKDMLAPLATPIVGSLNIIR